MGRSCLSICAGLIALATGSANAQEQEAFLRKLEVPGAGFAILIAMPKSPGGRTFDLVESPDALIVLASGRQIAKIMPVWDSSRESEHSGRAEDCANVAVSCREASR